MFKNLVPQDQIFFDMFDQMAVNIVDGALLLKKMVDNSDNNSEYAQQIKTLEHQTDELVHKTLSHLHTTFVTPIEREDIHRLLVKLDDILDLTNKASAGIDMNKPKTFPREMADLVEVLVESVRIIQQMVALLRHLKKKSQEILDLTVEINRLENQADKAHRKLLAQMFDEITDPIQLMKLKEIVEKLEDAADAFETVANIVESIALKES